MKSKRIFFVPSIAGLFLLFSVSCRMDENAKAGQS